MPFAPLVSQQKRMRFCRRVSCIDLPLQAIDAPMLFFPSPQNPTAAPQKRPRKNVPRPVLYLALRAGLSLHPPSESESEPDAAHSLARDAVTRSPRHARTPYIHTPTLSPRASHSPTRGRCAKARPSASRWSPRRPRHARLLVSYW